MTAKFIAATLVAWFQVHGYSQELDVDKAKIEVSRLVEAKSCEAAYEAANSAKVPRDIRAAWDGVIADQCEHNMVAALPYFKEASKAGNGYAIDWMKLHGYNVDQQGLKIRTLNQAISSKNCDEAESTLKSMELPLPRYYYGLAYISLKCRSDDQSETKFLNLAARNGDENASNRLKEKGLAVPANDLFESSSSKPQSATSVSGSNSGSGWFENAAKMMVLGISAYFSGRGGAPISAPLTEDQNSSQMNDAGPSYKMPQAGYQTRDSFGNLVNSNDSYQTKDSFGSLVNSNETYQTRDSFGNLVSSKDCYQTRDSFGNLVMSKACK